MPKIAALLLFSMFLFLTCAGRRPPPQGEHQAPVYNYGPKSGYKWIVCNPVQLKNFYLLTVLEHESTCRKVIEKDPVLKKLYGRYRMLAYNPDMDCSTIPACCTSAMLWDSAATANAGARLKYLYLSNDGFRAVIYRHMHGSGILNCYPAVSSQVGITRSTYANILESEWRTEAHGINRIITRYTTNKGFRYPDIDSASFSVRSPEFIKVVARLFKYYHQYPDTPLFFYPSMKLALNLLAANHRDEAARHEPLSRENKAAYRKIPGTEWDKYPYSVILVLGEGPDDNKPISDGCRRRCERGAALYRQGQAPFIVVSGGYVHPFQTPYCEAIEMRKYLANNCRVPVSAIIVEPHARHTTTNIRNTARIIYRAGVPQKKMILCTSSNLHIATVASAYFLQRTVNELHCVSFSGMKKISDSTAAFYPDVSSLSWDANDPLDP